MPIFTKLTSLFCALCLSACLYAGEEYRGKFTPDADYVLSGQLRQDIGSLPPMPYRYLTTREGYDESALTPVPPVGVHPRVLMSPEDISAIQARVTLGDQADRYFRIIWNDVQAKAKTGDMLCMGLKALVTDDDKLGRQAAEDLVKEARFREPIIDIFNTHEGMAHIRDNWYYYARVSISKVGDMYYDDAFEKGGAALIAKLARQGVTYGNDGDRHQSVFFNSVLMNYDYLYRWFTQDERTLVRRVLSKLTYGRYTTGMELPGHMFINNHMSMGEDLLLLNLAIEGEEGWDPRLLKEYAPAVCNKITYDVSLGGLLHEKCKGFLPERASLAIARRASQPESGALPLLAHDHLKLMVWGKVMDSTNLFARYGSGRRVAVPPLGQGLTESRFWTMGLGSGPWMDQFFNWAFLLKHVYPKDPVVDYYYKSRMRDHGLGAAGTDPAETLPTPRIDYSHRDVMLLMATDGLRDKAGQVIDYDDQGLPKEVLVKTEAWVDLARGAAMSRSSWDPNALMIHYECRSDVLSAGHETPEAGDFNLTAHGVEWSTRRDWYMDCYFRNMVLIDGYAGVYSPVAGQLMVVADNDLATTFVSDATDQYNWRKLEKSFQLWHPMFEQDLGLMAPYAENAMLLDREVELPFQTPIREYQEGYTGLDWGNWHGETRGPERFQRWNHVDHVYRTLHLVKGKTPYVLVIDDVRKDSHKHQYDWCFKLSPDVTLYKADSTVQNRYLQKGMPEDRTTDLILCLTDTQEVRYDRYGMQNERQPSPGDPMLLVRVLWRNAEFAFPQPALEASWGPKRVIIPAMAVDPEFRVLLFPFRFGEHLPITAWNSDRTRLTVSAGEHTDVYRFGKTEGERTLFTMARNSSIVAGVEGLPPRPELDTPHGYTPDRNKTDEVRSFVIEGRTRLHFKAPPAGMQIRYSLDGTPVSGTSRLYADGIQLTKSCVLRARTFARYWPFDEEGDGGSDLRVLNVLRQKKVSAKRNRKIVQGLKIKVYEICHTLYEGKNGIFTGQKNMVPSFADYAPVLSCVVPGLTMPRVNPQAPVKAMKQGYFCFGGYYNATADGLYGFKLNSCGPVQMTVAGQALIDVSGPYGHSQQDRFGLMVLARGLHEIYVMVCDPVFWKGEREAPYQVALSVMKPGDAQYLPCTNDLKHKPEAGFALQSPVPVPRSQAVHLGQVTPGLVMTAYDRSVLCRVLPTNGLPVSHLAIGSGETPYVVQPVLCLEPSDTAACLREFKGHFLADQAGVYEFSLDRKGGNQLTIGNHVILHNNVIASKLSGKIYLGQGAHVFSLRLAQSKAICHVKLPGAANFVSVNTGMFVRPRHIQVSEDGRLVSHVDGEALTGPNFEVRAGHLVSGKVGSAIQLSGKGSSLILKNIPSPEDALTISFWLRIETSSDVALLESSWESHPAARLRHYQMQTSFFRGSEPTSFDLRQVDADEGQWVHIALTYDSHKTCLYVNGELRDWTPKTVKERHAHVKDITLFRDLHVAVDELRVHNKALSDKEVAVLSR